MKAVQFHYPLPDTPDHVLRTHISTSHAELLMRMSDGREISYLTALPERLAEIGLIKLIRASGRRKDYTITARGLEAVQSMDETEGKK